MGELRKDIFTGTWVVTGLADFGSYIETLKNPDVRLDKPCPFCVANHEAETIFLLREEGNPRWDVKVIPGIEAYFHKKGDLNKRGLGLYDAMENIGGHELVIETPDHVKNLCNIEAANIEKVFLVYQLRMAELEKDQKIKYALVYKNQRKLSKFRFGHSHSHIVSTPVTPKTIKDELARSRTYYRYKERCMYCDVIGQERKAGLRIVEENERFICLTPYASEHPFQLLILPSEHNHSFLDESSAGFGLLARMMKNTLKRLDLLLDDPPIHWALHTSPFLRAKEGYWETLRQDYHWHIEIAPVLEECGAFEWSSGFYIEPVLPEECAELLKKINLPF